MNSSVNQVISSSPFLIGGSFGPSGSASAVVRKVAELFIKTLSTEETPTDWRVSHKSELISPEALRDLTDILTYQVAEDLMNGKQPEETSFYEIGRGKNNVVWGHPDYPNLVFKLMDSEAAEEQLEVGRRASEMTEKMENCWIQIPRSETLEIGYITAYIEELLPIGLDLYQHSELWARVLTYYQSSECSERFKGHLSSLINQIQLLIEQMGFSDVGYHNLPEVRLDGTGVCATDFENVYLGNNHVLKGLERIAYMFPVMPLALPVIEGYEKELQTLDLDLESLEKRTLEFHLRWERMSEGVKALQEAIKHYDEKGYDTGLEEILCCCDLSELDESEKTLAQHVLKTIAKTLSKEDDQKKTLTEKRAFSLKAGSLGECDYTHERLLKVLNVLKDQNIVISWSDNYTFLKETDGNLESVFYGVYF